MRILNNIANINYSSYKLITYTSTIDTKNDRKMGTLSLHLGSSNFDQVLCQMRSYDGTLMTETCSFKNTEGQSCPYRRIACSRNSHIRITNTEYIVNSYC